VEVGAGRGRERGSTPFAPQVFSIAPKATRFIRYKGQLSSFFMPGYAWNILMSKGREVVEEFSAL
jgi:hypothetical protein